MAHHHKSGATAASGAMTLDRAGPAAVAAAPMITATISVGGESDAVAANPLTGFVYVTSQLDNTVSVISGQTNMVTATIPVGNPQGMAVSPLSGDLYVTNFNDGTVSVITATIPVGSGPAAVAVNPLTGAVYTANIGDDTVSVISG
jgi:YVTN family beta-propeller protein